MTNKNFKTLLVAMPFHDIHQPNISLGILKSVLNNAGYHCDIYYANLEFADLIGRDLYNFFQKSMPLIGDLLFSELLSEKKKELTLSQSYRALTEREKKAFHEARKHVHGFMNNLTERIIAQNYDTVGFSLIFQTVPSLVLAKKIKERVPAMPIICGGANCVGDMGLALHENFEYIDYVCRGEGEVLIVELLDYLSGKGGEPKNIQGLIWRENGKSVPNGNRTATIHNLDDVPVPDYTDWWQQIEKYNLFYESKEWAISFESSRGCWYGYASHCIFCGLGGEDLKSRVKSPEKVLAEIRELSSKYPIKNLTAIDLIFPNQFYKEFLPALAKEELDIVLNYEIKANVSKKQLYQFRDASVMNVQPGIESLSSSVLRTMRKGLKSFVNIRLLKWTFGLGVNVIWNFVYGIPGEEKEEYAKMAKLIPEISHLQPPVFGCLPLGLVKNSPLFEEKNELGITKVRPLDSYYEIYDLPAEEIEKLAYYFNFGDEDPHKHDYVQPLKDAVSWWYRQIGESQFFSLTTDTEIHFHDTRSVAVKERHVLTGLDKQLYEVCDSGTSLHLICQQLKISEDEALPMLDKMIADKLIIFIDDKYLSLAVAMDELVNNLDDIDVGITLCTHVYSIWMKTKCEPYFDLGKKTLEAF